MCRLRFPPLLLALLGTPIVAVAQNGDRDRLSTVRGVAFDSLSRTPLSGARIWVQGQTTTATTDSSGRFAFSALPAGRQVLVLEHSELDDIGLANIAARVTVAAGETLEVVLATPSFATVWRRLCGTALPGADSGIVFGSVRDADSDSLLSGVAVDVAWRALQQTGRTRVDSRELGTRARSDAMGRYQVCGTAVGVTLFAQALAGPFRTGVTRVTAGARFLVRRDFRLGRPGPGDDSLSARRAALAGIVRTELGTAVAGAEVVINDAVVATTGLDGQFAVAHLTAGTQWLLVRAVGHTPVEQSVDLRSHDTVRLDLQLRAIVLLDSVQVVADRGLASMMLDEFEHRKRSRIAGYVFGEEELRRHNMLRSVFVGLPSTEMRRVGGDDVVVFTQRRSVCQAILLIDGTRAGFDELASLVPADLVGIEVYPPSMVPARYRPDARTCGIVLVWTKRLRH